MFSKRAILFTVLVLITFFQIARFISTYYVNGSSAGFRSLFNAQPGKIIHPIPKLMSDARTKYKALLARQSRSLSEAVAEYRRRYKRDPPKGFDDWYAFAIANKVKIIDEYDGMADDLEPFWDLSGEEIRRRVHQVSFNYWSWHLCSETVPRSDYYPRSIWLDFEMAQLSR